MSKISILKLIFLLIIFFYFMYCALTPDTWRLFMDGVDLMIHEPGHLIFMPFGSLTCTAGGTITQLLIPLILVIYFLNKNLYSGSLVAFWLGQSFINVSVYAKDAVDMKLPLIGGEHDWNFMLTKLNLLSYANFISSLFYFTGFLIILVAAILGLLAVINRDKYLEESQLTDLTK